MAKTKEAPAVLERWEVTWWVTENGYLKLRSRELEMPGHARTFYAELHASQDPSITRHHWDIAKARWETNDVVGQAVTVEQSKDVNARGFAGLRAIVAHGRGHDSRGVLGSLDEFLAGDGNDREPIEPLIGATAAECIVCDYLCQHGLSVDDAHAIVPETNRIEYRDITEHEELF